MSGSHFDGLTRQLGRRRALQALAAAVATTSGLTLAHAKNGKKKKNRNGKGRNKIFARCESQGPACEAFIRESCRDDAACLTAVFPCCEQIENCEFTAFVACFNAARN